jgi:hypothetical protein
MLRIRTFLIAAAVAAVAAVSLSAPASAGICDQQGRRVLIDGVWHKVVHNKRGGLVDCGPGNAF